MDHLICPMFLLMLCLTGLPLIFHDELTFWLGDAIEPPEYVSASEPVNLDVLIQDAKARRPQDAVKFLTKDDDYPMWFVSLGDTPMARKNSAISMYDQRTGKFLKEYPVGHGLIYVLLTFHVEMFADLWGTLFLGAMGLLFVVSVVSGIVVYGPFMRKLPFGTLRRQRSPRFAWLDLHNLLGIVTMTWVLVVGVTGVINTLDRPLLSYWQMTEITDMLTPWNDQPAPAQVSDSMVLPWYLTVLLLSQPLHFGDYGGMPLKVIWALLDVITIIVLLTGLYLCWQKRRSAAEDLLVQVDWAAETVFSPAPSAESR